MLSFFPNPLPDELLYSVLARYVLERGFKTRGQARGTLMGMPKRRISYVLSNCLDFLISILPPGHPYSADQLIDQHTLLLFYAPFFTLERAARARQYQKDFTYNNGKPVFKPAIIKCLRYCPLCVSADIVRHGFPYWHRMHHISVLDVCTIHQVWLEDSGVLTEATTEYFMTAEEAIKTLPEPRILDIADSDNKILYQLTQDAVAVLKHRYQFHVHMRGSEIYLSGFRADQLVLSKPLQQRIYEFEALDHFWAGMLRAKLAGQVFFYSFGKVPPRDWPSRLLYSHRPHLYSYALSFLPH